MESIDVCIDKICEVLVREVLIQFSFQTFCIRLNLKFDSKIKFDY